MRGGLNSVDYGQMEAGRALGLSYPTTMIKIIIPQAIKNILPTLGNEFITLIKETSVLSFIAVYDLYTAIKAIAQPDYAYEAGYLFMAVIYITIILFITLLIKLMELALNRSDRKSSGKKSKKSA
jgi:polar amino acid transport system permease protein